MPMTEDELAAIEARANAATPGPWRMGKPAYRCKIQHNEWGGGHASGNCRYEFDGWYDDENCLWQDKEYPQTEPGGWFTDGMVVGMWDYEEGGVYRSDDATFIAHARADVPALLAEVRRLRWKSDVLEAALNAIPLPQEAP